MVNPSKISALLRLARFWNLAIIGSAQFFSAIFLLDVASFDLRLAFLALSTIAIAAGGYIINDYYDIKIDLINKPNRVVIGKKISRRYAIIFHSFLSLTGVAMGFLLNWQIGMINFTSSFLLWLYSNHLKRQPLTGNLSVAFLTGLSIFVVGVLYQVTTLLIIYSLFAFAMTLIREIIKDVEDLKGDNTFGCKTLPIIWGIRKTKFFIYSLITSFSIGVIVINMIYLNLPYFYLFVLLFPLLVLLQRLIRADTVKDFYYLSQYTKAIMMLGVLSMPFVR